jgi:curved DNA-binding protein CbpA
MPAAADYDGLGQHSTPVRLVPGVDLTRAPLSPEECFVLSRVDEHATLQTLCHLSVLGLTATCQILRRLAELGLVRIGDLPVPLPAASAPDPRPGPTASAPAVNVLPDEPDVDLKPEVRLAIRRLHARLGEMSFFQLLDIDPGADATAIRRAYFKRSKEFHPDRYFSKRLGPYRVMLDEIFKQISAAYHFLEDESQRIAYRDMVNQEAADAAQLAEVEAQGAQALSERQVAESAPGPAPVKKEGARVPESRARSGQPRPRFPWEPARAPTGPAAPAVTLDPVEQAAREQRRQEDRRRRLSRIADPLMPRPRQARQFYEQGLRQLGCGQVVAAAASLKLALSIGGDDPGVQKAYLEAVEKSCSQTAENYFKRAVFEESVGRQETALRYFVRAADTLPKSTYLSKAAEAIAAAGDLIKARDYATRAVQNDPKSADARIALARVLAAAGMKKNARLELEQAIKLEPRNPVIKELLKSLK